MEIDHDAPTVPWNPFPEPPEVPTRSEALHAILGEVKTLTTLLAKPPERALVVSVEEAGARLGCGRNQIFKLLRQGILDRAPRLGRKVMILAATLQRALEAPASKAGRKQRKSSGDFQPIDVRDIPL
jgi:excisionase family DNA binding protein